MLLQYGPHFFSTLLEKFGQLARFFWANGLPPPLAKTFPYAYDAFDRIKVLSEPRSNHAWEINYHMSYLSKIKDIY